MFQEPLLPSLRSVLQALNVKFESRCSWPSVQQPLSSSAIPTEGRSRSHGVDVAGAGTSSLRQNELPSFASTFGPDMPLEAAHSGLHERTIYEQPAISLPRSRPDQNRSDPYPSFHLRAKQSPSTSTAQKYPNHLPSNPQHPSRPAGSQTAPNPSDVHSLTSNSSQRSSGPAHPDFPMVFHSTAPITAARFTKVMQYPLHMSEFGATPQVSVPSSIATSSQQIPWSPNQPRSSTSTSPFSGRFSLDGFSSASDDLASDKGSPSGPAFCHSDSVHSRSASHMPSGYFPAFKNTHKTVSSIVKSSRRKTVKYPEKSRVASSRKRVRGRFVKEDQLVLDEKRLLLVGNPVVAVGPDPV